MRLIDADKITLYYAGLKHIGAYDFQSIAKYFYDQIQEQPTVDPVKHGKWEPVARGLRVKCSVCESGMESHPIAFSSYDFCPHCGAKMDLEEDKK